MQEVPRTTIGASYGAAFLAAVAVAPSGETPDITIWNPVATVVSPRAELAELYDERFAQYRRLYEDTKDLVHELVTTQASREGRTAATREHPDQEST